MRILPVSALLLVAFLPIHPAAATQDSIPQGFDHVEHEAVFPDCATCHVAPAGIGETLWPPPASCEVCHDGAVQQRVVWTPREAPRSSNLRFDHTRHEDEVAAEGREAATCVDCHAGPDEAWMTVRVAVVDQCLDCHEVREDHLAAPDGECSECHLPLAEATNLTDDDVAAFSAPPSHDAPGFGAAGHGPDAEVPGDPAGVAGSCATCHARDFCVPCHVDAPEQPPIQALGLDPRSLLHPADLAVPETHDAGGFLGRHGLEEADIPAGCGTCHTRESCTTCHVATVQVARDLSPMGPGRGAGAVVERVPPETHGPDYEASFHGAEAAARPETCAGCHAREDCLACHRPDPAAGLGGYHPVGFLSRHPAGAYSRETSCADCHEAAAFCADCHAQAGLVAMREQLGAGYHDAKRSFSLGHGVAARQGLESCVTCHVENDCLTCHSALGGRGFSPHGPGFDGERLRERNPDLCRACHIGGGQD